MSETTPTGASAPSTVAPQGNSQAQSSGMQQSTSSSDATQGQSQSQQTQQNQSSTQSSMIGQQTQQTAAGDTASTGPKWYDSLPDDLKADQNITRFGSVADLAKSYKNASQLIGRDKIPVPKTAEEMREVLVRLGMPNDAAEYRIGPELGAQFQVEDLKTSPESGESLEDWKKCYKKRAHEFGLTQAQAAAVYETMVRETNLRIKQRAAEVDAEMQACGAALKKAWGEQMEVNLVVAGKTLRQHFGETVAKKIEAAGLGRDAEFIQGLHRIGSRSLEELGLDKRGTALKAPSQLDGEISALMAHPGYFDKKHPEHGIVVNKVSALMQRRYPEPARA